MVDPITNMPIVVLREHEGERVLPIWVGVFEANAIAIQIENIETPRPMTHDLIRNMLVDLNAHVEKIVIANLKENTFYASIHLQVDGEEVSIDSRPFMPFTRKTSLSGLAVCTLTKVSPRVNLPKVKAWCLLPSSTLRKTWS